MTDLQAMLWPLLTAFLGAAVPISILIRPYLRQRDELTKWRTLKDAKEKEVDARLSALEGGLAVQLREGFEKVDGSISKLHTKVDDVKGDLGDRLDDLNTRTSHMEGAIGIADWIRRQQAG